VPQSPDVLASRTPARLLATTGAIGLLAAFILSVDKVQQLQDKLDGKDSLFNCDISAWVTCSTVIASDQSAAFGFPNSFIGVIGFSVVLTLGVVALAGSSLPNWMWAGLQAGTIFGIGFVTWLQVQSIHVIGALCPYCMVVWAVMIPLFIAVTAESLRRFAGGSGLARFVSNWTLLLIALWYIAVVAAIWFAFGSRIFT
jgi:uncharacterized membrane protein